MLPYSLPSSVSAFGRRQMKAYPYTPKAGDVAWVNYIPVKFVSDNYQEGTYNQKGFVAIDILSSNTGKQAWVDYVPVVIDSTRTDAWIVNSVGYIPVNFSGTGDGTAANKGLSLNFVGASTLDPRITFSRASNATVTGSNGLIQYAPHNLLTYSEQFDNAAWVKTTTTISANTLVAPDNTTTADTLTASGANSTSLQTFTASAVPYTFSVYLYRKTGTGNIDITVDGTTWVTKTITAGWTRVDTSLTPTAGSKTAGIRIATNGDAVYAWGAQLNVGSLQPYYTTTVKNLVGYSEAFDNAAWGKVGTTVSATKVSSPNGTITGQKLQEDTSTGVHNIQQSVFSVENGKAYSVSIYAKAAERSFLHIRGMGIGSGGGAVFNLSTGVIQQVAGYSSAFIESVGNGWYRCTAIGTAAAGGTSANPNFGCSIVGGTSFSYTGDGTSGIYIWGAQMADATSVVPYVNNPVAAPTAAAYYGARFDYDPVTLQPKGLLIEEQRTNLLQRSEALATSPWFNSGLTSLTNNTTDVTDPAGTNTATKAVVAASSGAIGQTVTLTAAVHTGSVWLRCSSGTVSGQLIVYLGASPFTNIGTANITITTTWQRFTVTTSTATAASYNFQIHNLNGGTVYAWGAQLEAGAFATSYIPTIASQVTRSADVALIQGSNFSGWFNASEGSFLANTQIYNTTARNSAGFDVQDGTTNNRLIFRAITTGSADQMVVRSGSTTVATLASAVGISTNIRKNSMRYKLDNFALTANGTAIYADTSGAVPVSVTNMLLGSATGSTEFLNGYIRQIAYYPRALTDTELQAVTA